MAGRGDEKGMSKALQRIASSAKGGEVNDKALYADLNSVLDQARGLDGDAKTRLSNDKGFITALREIEGSGRCVYEHFISIGNIFFVLNLLDDALRLFTAAKDLNETREAINNLGVVYSRLGMNHQAEEHLKRAIELGPGNGQNWFNLGKAYFRQDRLDDAMRSFKKAVELDPKNKSAWNNLGVCMRNLGLIEEALTAYDRALLIDKRYVWAWDNRGKALMELEQYKSALEAFDNALAIRPDFKPAMHNRDECVKLMKKRPIF